MGSRPTLEQIQERLRDFRDEREWARFHSPANLASAISIEAAELLELFLWSSGETEKEVLTSRHLEIEAELADVMIQCLNFADAAEIDVLGAIDRKIDENAEKYPVALSKGRSTKYSRRSSPE
jgi:NTP pyrophosphatase (non-canonical NTP hydrolase)